MSYQLTGTVQSGGTGDVRPLQGVHVTAYEATADAPRVVGSADSDAGGRFTIPISDPAADAIVYLGAAVSPGVQLVTIVGPQIGGGSFTINELTTVAAAYSMAQFTENGAIAGNAFGLRIAAGMNDNLVSPATGQSSEVLLASPNGDETNSLRSTRALANLVAGCVRGQPGALDTLLALATTPWGERPGDTFQALANIARNPGQNVGEIYAQALATELYQPTLQAAPDAWTLAVKVNDSGDDEFLFGGPANIAWDRDGYAWVTNNVVQGTGQSGNFIVVLQPNGKPARGENGAPVSPVFGGGLVGPGFGVDIDRDGNVWVGNYGWGGVLPADGSVSVFDPHGVAVSGPDGYVGETYRVQSTVIDRANNVWMASYGNDGVVVFLDGDPSNVTVAWEDTGSAPFGIALAENGMAWVTNSGGLRPGGASSVAKYRIDNGAVVRVFSTGLGHSLKGLSIDPGGRVWIASGGDDVVYVLDSEGDLAGTFDGGGSTVSPWSVTIDGDGHAWGANFGPMEFGADYTTAAVVKLAGFGPGRLPPGLQPGDAISPPSGYTLPSAGAQVLLHNGDPLYGPGADPCYCPLMRMTNCVIDQAGNVWAINNWKPDYDQDINPVSGNPGGDGIVIFVGMAKPPAWKY
jgi:hypothetical protein